MISGLGQKVRLPQKRLRGSRCGGSRNVIVGRSDYLKKGWGARYSRARGKVLSPCPRCLSTRPNTLCNGSGWVETYLGQGESTFHLARESCQNMSKNASLKIGWPGGQNVRTLRESRLRPLRRSQRSSGAQIPKIVRLPNKFMNSYICPIYPKVGPWRI